MTIAMTVGVAVLLGISATLGALFFVRSMASAFRTG
jgi:hypothetical protein